MTDILTPEEVKGRDLRTNEQTWDYLRRLEATVEALKRFARAKQRGPSVTEYDAARQVIEEAGWLE